jgi:FMN-dependent NADH-azoreductase
MSKNTLLQVNSSGRFDGSVTRQVSNALVNLLKQAEPELAINQRELASGLPFIDEQWIAANFTPQDQRNEQHLKALNFSDKLVNELAESNTLVVASPIYNFSIPAVLKAWIDLIARAQLTFKYTENGPQGLLTGKKAFVVAASGGVPIGSEMDFATNYLKQVLGFIGISDVTIIDTSKVFQDGSIDQTTLQSYLDLPVLEQAI